MGEQPLLVRLPHSAALSLPRGRKLTSQSHRDRSAPRAVGARTSRRAPGGSLSRSTLPCPPPHPPTLTPPASAVTWPSSTFTNVYTFAKSWDRSGDTLTLGRRRPASFRLRYNSDRVSAGGWGQRIPMKTESFPSPSPRPSPAAELDLQDGPLRARGLSCTF